MKTVITFLSILSFLSCSSSKCQTDTAILNQEFSINEISGNKVLKDDMTISFNLEEGTVFGYSGCNNFNGTFTIEKETITFGPLVSTKMMCLEENHEFELFEILSGTKTFSIEENIFSLSENNNKSILLKATMVSNKNNRQQDDTIVFEYQARSRGYYLNVSMSNDGEYVTVATHPDMKPNKQSYKSEDWQTLTKEFDKLNLEELSNLEPPSKDFQFDGAAMATLKIYFNEKAYETAIFDHRNSPQEIAEIVKILLSYSPEKG